MPIEPVPSSSAVLHSSPRRAIKSNKAEVMSCEGVEKKNK